MNKCGLIYIPKHLHWEDRFFITQFAVGDLVYRRCNKEEFENPYKTISLTELSHNLGVNRGVFISNEKDVLFSIKEDELFESYENKEVCVLEIKSLNYINLYRKSFKEVKQNIEYTAEIAFLHDPVNCMYPHCFF